MRKNSIKNIRINGEVRRELSQIIRDEVKDPRIHPMTSIMRVEVAPDLKSCKAFVTVMGSAEEREMTIKGLRAAEGFIRRELAHNLNLRNTPEIRFIPDDSIAYGVSMSHRIDEVIRQDEEAAREGLEGDGLEEEDFEGDGLEEDDLEGDDLEGDDGE